MKTILGFRIFWGGSYRAVESFMGMIRIMKKKETTIWGLEFRQV